MDSRDILIIGAVGLGAYWFMKNKGILPSGGVSPIILPQGNPLTDHTAFPGVAPTPATPSSPFITQPVHPVYTGQSQVSESGVIIDTAPLDMSHFHPPLKSLPASADPAISHNLPFGYVDETPPMSAGNVIYYARYVPAGMINAPTFIMEPAGDNQMTGGYMLVKYAGDGSTPLPTVDDLKTVIARANQYGENQTRYNYATGTWNPPIWNDIYYHLSMDSIQAVQISGPSNDQTSQQLYPHYPAGWYWIMIYSDPNKRHYPQERYTIRVQESTYMGG